MFFHPHKHGIFGAVKALAIFHVLIGISWASIYTGIIGQTNDDGTIFGLRLIVL